MGFKNTWNIIYDDIAEKSLAVLKGDFYLSNIDIVGTPATASVELHATGSDRIILRDGFLHFIGASAYIKFNDGTTQNTAGVGSAGNVTNSSDVIIESDNADSSTGDIIFNIYDIEAMKIDNSTKKLITNYGVKTNEIQATTGDIVFNIDDIEAMKIDNSTKALITNYGIKTDEIQATTASADMYVKNSAGDIIGKFKDNYAGLEAYGYAQYLGYTGASTTFDFYIGRYMNGFVCLTGDSGGAIGVSTKLYHITSGSTTGYINLISSIGNGDFSTLTYLGYTDPYNGTRYAQKFRVTTIAGIAGVSINWMPFTSGADNQLVQPII